MDDMTLRRNVVDELDFEPSIDASDIGVAVQDGVVTLTGRAPNFAQKHLAETAVRRVKGVRGIAEELRVERDGSNPYSDDDIARRVLGVLDLNVLVPTGRIQVKAEHGWITLTGEVEWEYQRMAAVDDLRKLRGVMGVSNNVVVKPRATAPDVQRRIEDALKRSAEVEAKAIKITVLDGEVRLQGWVGSWSDRRTLERAAWSAPGVRAVHDEVRVSA